MALAAIIAIATSASVIAATKSSDKRSPRLDDAIRSGHFTGFHTRVGGAPFPPDQQMLTDLRDLALFIGLNSGGDPSPSSGRVWATSRSRANELVSHSGVDTDQPSYVIVLHGDFVVKDAPRPPGAEAPEASVLTMIVDPRTGEITDFGIHNDAPDLSSLGPGVDLGISG